MVQCLVEGFRSFPGKSLMMSLYLQDTETNEVSSTEITLLVSTALLLLDQTPLSPRLSRSYTGSVPSTLASMNMCRYLHALDFSKPNSSESTVGTAKTSSLLFGPSHKYCKEYIRFINGSSRWRLAMESEVVHFHHPDARVCIIVDEHASDVGGMVAQLAAELADACCILPLDHHLPANHPHSRHVSNHSIIFSAD